MGATLKAIRNVTSSNIVWCVSRGFFFRKTKYATESSLSLILVRLYSRLEGADENFN